MDAGGFFRGTSADQDSRFSDKTKKYISVTDFPPEFDIKVDMTKVRLEALKPWIANKITQLLGFDDDVLINFTIELLEDKEKVTPNPKELQHQLEGFLEKDTPAFVKELWMLLISANENESGIPSTLLEQKKNELRQKREDSDRIEAAVNKQRDTIEQEYQKKGKDNHTELKQEKREDTDRQSSGSYRHSQPKRGREPSRDYIRNDRNDSSRRDRERRHRSTREKDRGSFREKDNSRHKTREKGRETETRHDRDEGMRTHRSGGKRCRSNSAQEDTTNGGTKERSMLDKPSPQEKTPFRGGS